MATCIRSVKLILGLIVTLLLLSCGDNSQNYTSGEEPSTGIALPIVITQSKLPDTGTISAYISVDGGTRRAMVVEGETASITLSDLSPGSHDFTLIIEYTANSDPGNPITLVETTKTLEIVSGNNTGLVFTDADHQPNYSASDDDGDGVGNLFELLTDNANLAGIELSAGKLDQIFDPELTAYDATVGFLAKSIQINATTENENATLTIDGISSVTGQASDPIALGEDSTKSISIVVTSADSSTPKTYILSVTRQALGNFAQSAYIKASNTGAFDRFGTKIAIHGDLLAVGVIAEDSNGIGINSETQDDNSATESGAVYVFSRDSIGMWAQQAYIKASNTEAGDNFGQSVALFGNTLAVGAWREDNSGVGINNGTETNNAAIESGAVYIFTRDSGIWEQQAYIKGSNSEAGDLFGVSLSLYGDTLAVGANSEDSNGIGFNNNPQIDNSAEGSGAAYVFVRSGNTWSQQAYIKASNTDAGDNFGSAISIFENTLAVAAPGEDGNGTGVNSDTELDNSLSASGAVYVFTRNNLEWSQQAYIKATNSDMGDSFGSRISLSENSLAVGAPNEDSIKTGTFGETDPDDNLASNAGAVYLFFQDNSSVWSQQSYIKASNTDIGDLFGASVALSGDTLVVGSFDDSNGIGVNSGSQMDNSANLSGAAYVFTRGGNAWNQNAFLKASNAEANDWFGGRQVSISGDTIAIGAIHEKSSGIGINSNTQENNSIGDSGAVYVFR